MHDAELYSAPEAYLENADVKKHQFCSWLSAQSHIPASAEILTFNQMFPNVVVFGIFLPLFVSLLSLLSLILMREKLGCL